MLENKISSTHRLVLIALMIAANVVLSRFLSISLWNLKIGFAFLPVVVTAILLGPLAGGIVGGLADFVGANLFPIGPYFPGFSLVGFLVGVTYGIFLHKKQNTKNIVIAVVLTELIGSVVLNSLWISLLYGAPYLSLLPPRLIQGAGMGVVEILVIRMIANYVPQLQKAV